jgi:preprotein translocase subunit Sss1
VSTTAKRLLWFVGLWAAGVIVVGAIGLVIRAVLR